jgi:hypothetical protein
MATGILFALSTCSFGVAGSAERPPANPARLAARATHVLDGAVFYVAMDDGTMDAFLENTWENVGHWSGLPLTDGIRGVDADPETGTLFFSHGSTSAGPGSLFAWNLAESKARYDVTYPHGIDQHAYGNGIIYMPSGEASRDSRTYLIDAATGAELGSEPSGERPHNTIYKNGHRYSGGMRDKYLVVQGIGAGAIGPSPSTHYGVRPFTVNGDETRAYITWSGYRGYSIGNIQTGEIITSVDFGPNPEGAPLGASHGISLSPDNRELYVLDVVNNQVRVYDASDHPTLLATLALYHPIYPGEESPCAHTCHKSGWLLHSLDGKYVIVGDSGDVIDTRTRSVVHNLAPIQNSRHGFIEIDGANGVVVATSTHFGTGHGEVR